MNLEEINNTIAELETGETTFVNCQKLASLYTVRDNYGKSISTVEIQDTLPAYTHYCDIKGQYQRSLLPAESVHIAMESVCKELSELISLIYSNSDMEQERILLVDCVQTVWESLINR